MSGVAVLLFLAGAVGLFFPDEIAGALSPEAPAGAALLLQILAAAWVALGMADWTARRAPLGGIYGRALVVGNTGYFAIATIVLLRETLASPTPAIGIALLLHACGAALFAVLLLRGP